MHDLDDRIADFLAEALLPQTRRSDRIEEGDISRPCCEKNAFRVLQKGRIFVNSNFRDSFGTPREVSAGFPRGYFSRWRTIALYYLVKDVRLGGTQHRARGCRVFGPYGRMSIGQPSQSGHRNERQSSGGNGGGAVTRYGRIWIASCQLVD